MKGVRKWLLLLVLALFVAALVAWLVPDAREAIAGLLGLGGAGGVVEAVRRQQRQLVDRQDRVVTEIDRRDDEINRGVDVAVGKERDIADQRIAGTSTNDANALHERTKEPWPPPRS